MVPLEGPVFVEWRLKKPVLWHTGSVMACLPGQVIGACVQDRALFCKVMPRQRQHWTPGRKAD